MTSLKKKLVEEATKSMKTPTAALIYSNKHIVLLTLLLCAVGEASEETTEQTGNPAAK